jgi:hypothetical protein
LKFTGRGGRELKNATETCVAVLWFLSDSTYICAFLTGRL